ncbi:MAG: NADH:ubiquinone oxidoreductase subunit NDUFA12 [Rhodospirillales bacterium]|nr:NADH:ubiquinone oxidoreductase subunit NDUFA12 [Rhodospirillales bacterium]
MATLGTLIYTLFRGERIGTDEFGNRYYRARRARRHGRERRWVIYRGDAEASKVPSEWHAWLHHTVDAPLTQHAAEGKSWQKSHLPNLTGTAAAYRPGGHEFQGGRRQPTTADYEPWRPKN